MKADILKTLKVLLGIPAENVDKDALLNVYIDDMFERVLSYTNRQDVPLQLVSTIAMMVKDVYESVTNPKVKSISESDASVTFAELDKNSILGSYEKTLARYKIMAWNIKGCECGNNKCI